MVDREKVIKKAERIICSTVDRDMIDSFCEDVIDLLKDQPEVIRCKDCKHCEYPKSEKEWCKKGHLYGNAETWFCADGERR